VSRWTDLAAWRGPTINEGDGDAQPGEAADRLSSHRGLVVHIASGYFEGTISWQHNAAADVSSHFVVARDGRIAQCVDTADRAWTQRTGNHDWLSVECEGFALDDALHASHPGWERLTTQQIDAIAQLLLRGHQEYGYPLQLASSPTGLGLGHHSMGAENGYDWGHSHCPGEPIKAQKPAILARALVLAGSPTSATGGDVELDTQIPGSGYGSTPETLDLRLALIDLTKALDPYDTSSWQNEALRNSRAILAGLAADEKRDAVLLATLQAMAAGGTSVDTVVLLARINAVAAEESTKVLALTAQVAELKQKLAAAAAAEAGALAQ
jgi:hypothetical protein